MRGELTRAGRYHPVQRRGNGLVSCPPCRTPRPESNGPVCAGIRCGVCNGGQPARSNSPQRYSARRSCYHASDAPGISHATLLLYSHICLGAWYAGYELQQRCQCGCASPACRNCHRRRLTGFTGCGPPVGVFLSRCLLVWLRGSAVSSGEDPSFHRHASRCQRCGDGRTFHKGIITRVP